jgi:hypothetical protein
LEKQLGGVFLGTTVTEDGADEVLLVGCGRRWDEAFRPLVGTKAAEELDVDHVMCGGRGIQKKTGGGGGDHLDDAKRAQKMATEDGGIGDGGGVTQRVAVYQYLLTSREGGWGSAAGGGTIGLTRLGGTGKQGGLSNRGRYLSKMVAHFDGKARRVRRKNKVQGGAGDATEISLVRGHANGLRDGKVQSNFSVRETVAPLAALSR